MTQRVGAAPACSPALGTPSQATPSQATPARPPAPVARSRESLLTRTGPGWPLVAMLLGWPLWWVLGLAELVPLAVAGVMAVQLTTRRVVHLPRGFGWWLLFLLWVVLGAAMLWVDAPGAVPGGDASRLLIFGFRLAWYAACTVAVVWITTMPRREVPDRLVHGSVAAIFAIATAGGLLALAAPTLEFRSALELVLPTGLRGNGFVQSLVHVQVADLQSVLGSEGARPKAPFAYTNTWGSVVSMSLVFLVAWVVGLRGRRRVPRAALALAVVLCAVPPVLYSLNRGLWGALALAAVGLAVLAAVRGRPALLVAFVALGGVVLVTVLATPLGGLVTDRMDNQHSNDRRGELLTLTTRSVSTGSPVLGFGSTRDVQGSFASITGASTPECPGCGVPPLGTQGQLWTVLFSQGWFGLCFFLLFIVLALGRSVRCRTVNEAVCAFTAGIFLLQLPVYDTLGLPLFVLMLAVGLAAREHREQRGSGPPRALTTVARLEREARRAAPYVLLGTLVGGSVGLGVALVAPPPQHLAKAWMGITPAPVYLDSDVAIADDGTLVDDNVTRDITVDTEAALLMSESTLSEAAEAAGATPAELRDSLAVTGVPSTHVLVLNLRWHEADRIPALVTAVTDSYFEARKAYLDQRRDDLVAQLREQLRTLDDTAATSRDTRARLSAAIDELERGGGEVGEVLRRGEPVPGRRSYELFTMSGAALGLLAACTLMTLVAPRARRTT